MDPLEAPLPGLIPQTSDNTGWMDDLEDTFFTVPPVEERSSFEPFQDDEEEEDEILYRASSPWPARLFLGACVGGVAIVALYTLPASVFAGFFGPESIRYPVNDVVTEVDTGPEQAPQRTAQRMRRSKPRASAPRPAAPSPVPGVVRPPPLRVDALPPLDLSSLQPGAAL